MYSVYSNQAAVMAANYHDIINDDLFFAGLTAVNPEALMELWGKRRWAVHRNKIPFNPLSGINAKSNDPHTCVLFSDANAALDEYDGVEYLLGEGVCGIDLDHCIDETGKVNAEALRVVDMLDSYAELSPSGTGIHILVRGNMPFTGRQGSRDATLQIEMYSEQRFLTITGLAINDLPIAERTKEIEELADQYFPATDISKEPGTASAPLDPDNSQKMILSALDVIDPADCDYMQWIRVGVGLKEAGLGPDIWDDWSSRDPDRYKPGECQKKWNTFKEPGQNNNGSGIIIELAKENGWQIGEAFTPDEKENYFRRKALSELQQMQHLSQTSVADPVAIEEDKQDEADEPHIDISCLSGSPHFGSEYASMEIEKPDYFIDGLLPVGGIILAGPPKIGKSLIALDMAYCVAGKEDYLGRKTKKAPVVYYALEDYDYRIKERILIQGRQDKDRYDTPVIVTEAKRLNDGLNDEIKRFLELNGKSLVIIDTFQCVRPSNQSGTAEYKQDYPLISALSKLAREYNSTILLIHHTKKTPDESNPFNMINGSVALQGATDAMMVITRNAKQRSTGNATLHATGRDIGTDEIELVFNKDNLTWTEAAVTKENSRRDCYDLDPVMITIRTIMEEYEADDNLIDKEYIVTMSDLLLEVQNRTGQCGEMTALQCGAVIRKYIDLLEEDGIAVSMPQGNMRVKGGKSCRYYKFRLIG